MRKEIIPTTIKEEAIVDLLKNRFNRDQLFRLDTLRDYGIDSLGLIDLIVFFEESLGINIDIHIAATAQTLEEFIKYIAGIEKKIGSSIEDKIFKSEIITKMPKFFPLTHHITLLFFKFLSKLFWKVEVVNAKFFENDNCIIASNHQSYLDIVWIATSVPVSRRRYLYAIGKKRLTFLKYIFPMLPAIFIDDKNTLSSLKASSDILRAGKSLIIFPEGTRTINGSIADFKNGAAYLAKNLNKKIIPVTISGGFEIFPKNRIFPKIFSGLKGRVVIGQPVDPADFCSVDELNLEIMRVIKSNATI